MEQARLDRGKSDGFPAKLLNKVTSSALETSNYALPHDPLFPKLHMQNYDKDDAGKKNAIQALRVI